MKTMSVYGQLAPMIQQRTLFVFNMPNIAYPNQHIDIEIPHDSRDHVIITSTDKAHSVVNNVGRALVKKKVLILGWKDIDTINKSDIYDTYKVLYLSEKEHEEKLLQGIQSANGLKAQVSAKNQIAQLWQWQPKRMPLKRRLKNGLQYR